MPLTRRASRDAALIELQRLHAAILASRAKRGVGPDGAAAADAIANTGSPEMVATRELTRRLQADTPDVADDLAPPAARSHRAWWLALGAAAILAGTWAALTLTQRREVVTEAAPVSPRAAPASVPPDTAGAAAPPAAAPARPIRVSLATIRPVWLRVTVDGARALEREVPAGETLSFDGDRAVVVRSGDAGGVRATMNGVDRGPLGRDGWPLTVPFTLDPPAPAAPAAAPAANPSLDATTPRPPA